MQETRKVCAMDSANQLLSFQKSVEFSSKSWVMLVLPFKE